MADSSSLRKQLVAGIDALALPVDADAIDRLLAYVALLERWNATYNLTAIRDPAEMITKHLLDSLAIAPHVDATSLADLGSGAGLPGIALAIVRSDLDVFSVESAGKKARFQREVARQLALPRLHVVEGRAEAAPATPCARVTARALASLADLLPLAERWLAPGGRVLAMKGPGVEDELRALPAGWKVEATHALHVPGLDAARWLVVLSAA